MFNVAADQSLNASNVLKNSDIMGLVELPSAVQSPELFQGKILDDTITHLKAEFKRFII